MGFLGGDNDSRNDDANQLADKQFQQNQAELEAKKQDLYQTKLDIAKSQGGQSWVPNKK